MNDLEGCWDVSSITSIEKANDEIDALLSPNSLERAFTCEADIDERICALNAKIDSLTKEQN